MRDLGLERPPGAQSNGPALLAVTIVSFTFVVVSTFLRVIARLYLVRQFGVEDYLILLATVRYLVTAGSSFTTNSLRVHSTDGCTECGSSDYRLHRQTDH